MVIRFIGDVHGKFKPYKKLIADVPRSIQVGDMGVGFRRIAGWREGEEYSNPPHYAMTRGNHRFIRGNHDNPAACAKHSQWIADGHVEDRMMFIGGATSIDKAFRLEGYSWWPDEELSIERLYELTDQYLQVRPRIMVTHECPDSIAALILMNMRAFGSDQRHNGIAKLEPEWSSRTRQAFQSMWSAHSPKLWVFGHWHSSFDHTLNGTRFVCLNELEHIDIDIVAI